MSDTSPWSRLKSEVYSFFGRNPKSNRMVPAMADLEPAHSVLDIGCGPGAAVRTASESVARAVGIDRSEPMIAIARRRSERFSNVEFYTAGAEDLPFDDAQFDRVWTIRAFHHWENRDQGMTECFRVLRPHGRLLIVENETTGAHGLSASAASEVTEALRSVGFTETSVSSTRKELVITAIRGE